MPSGLRGGYQLIIPPDDPYLTVYISDISLGMDSRTDGERLLPGGVEPGPNQCELLYNLDLSTPGQAKKREGLLIVGSAFSAASGVAGLASYSPGQSTASAGLFNFASATLRLWKDTGDWVTVSAGFSASTSVEFANAGLSGHGDVLVIQTGQENAYVFYPAGTLTDQANNNDSPPRSLAMAYYRNRLWCFGDEANADKDDWLFWSNAFPSAFSGAFDRTTNALKVNAGEGGKGMAVAPFREEGLVLFKDRSIWALPLTNTDISANQLTPIDRSKGLVARKAWAQVGDDIWYLSPDGVRSLIRTEQDKLKGFSFPLSYFLKDEFDNIAWASVTKACAAWWNSMFFLSLPTAGSTTNNQVWVAWPAFTYQVGTELFPAWVVITGWNVSAWVKRVVSGEERLYAADATSGKVYEVFGVKGNDNGSAINMQYQSRTFNFGLPLQKKVAGELLVRALSSGNYDITASLSVDDQDFTRLGTMNLSVSGANLPLNLPFNLVGQSLIEKSFHLDQFGEFKRSKIKLQANDVNTGDDIIIIDVTMTAWPVEYSPE